MITLESRSHHQRSPAVVLASSALLLLLSMSSAACGTLRVTLQPAPSASASLEERDAYYEEHKPLGIAGEPNGYNNLGWAAQGRFPALQLADGTRVVDPMDLAPAVGIDSKTMAAASRHKDLWLFANSLNTIGAIGFGTGLVTAMAGQLAFVGGGGDASLLVVATGGLAVMCAGLAGIGFGTDLAMDAEGEKVTAFFLYDRDLRRRLALKTPGEALPLEEKWATGGPMSPPPARRRAPPARPTEPGPASPFPPVVDPLPADPDEDAPRPDLTP